MLNDFHSFFNYIKLDEIYHSYFNDASLNKVVVKDELIHVYFSLKKPLDTRIISALLENIKDSLFVLHINYEDKKFNDKLINEYYQFIIDYLYGEYPIYDTLKAIELDYKNNEIIINLNTKSLFDVFSAYESKISEWFKYLGFNVPIKINVNENSVEIGEKLIEKERQEALKLALEARKKLEEENELNSNTNNPFAEHPLAKNAIGVTISELDDNAQNIYFKGMIFDKEEIKRMNGTPIYVYSVTDNKSSVTVKCRQSRFFKVEEFANLEVGGWYYFFGSMEYDSYARENQLMAIGVASAKRPEPRKDYAKEKRVELHLHTKMSTMDGVSTISDYVKQAVSWGHKAIAVTDHASVQAFPEFQKATKGKPIKPIYGMEAYMIDDRLKAVINPNNQRLDDSTYVVFDLETTGLSAKYDKIIEFGAVKVKNGFPVDRYQTFINPEIPLSDFTTSLTGITNNDVKNKPTIEKALPQIINFIGDAILVAHNAQFDFEFLNQAMIVNGFGPLKNATIDTLALSRLIFTGIRSFSLGSVCNHLTIPYDDESAHRADYDANVLKQVYEIILVKLLNDYELKTVNDLLSLKNENFMKTSHPYHVTILVKNNDGLKSLYELVSAANCEYLGDYPYVPRSLLEQKRENLLIGSACFNGEIYDIAATKTEETLIQAMKFYDYIEIQPIDNYSYLVDTKRVESNEIIKRTLIDIVNAAKKADKLVVATSDAHYLDPDIKIVRDIYISSLSVGNRAHPLYDYRGRVKENPNQHFRTTDEMLKCMEFLDEDLAYEITVTNTNTIADLISDDIYPIKDKLFYPIIDNCEEELQKMCYDKAKSLYGEPLPPIVLDRIQKEIKSILDNKFAVIYYISHKLVKMSLENGYLVGSRGSVGSSFVATLMDITEVNPLPPHYLCPNCKHSIFYTDGSVKSGFDLEDKECPKCNSMMKGEGQNIQFETFLGFKGDKVPDIDLNFSSEFQAQAHNYTKVLLGEQNVLRAGTISTVAEKTAFGYVLGYFEKHPELRMPRRAEIKRLALLCKDVKRTTGQHPGGIIVIPRYLDVHDITPMQYPADELNSAWRTTHFDYNAIHDEVLKLDLLGHVDPTAIRMLQDLTGVNPLDIPFNDEKVLSLFSSKEALNLENDKTDFENGAAGIPEFGTSFVRKMLDDTKPTKFSELIQISGLSHGKDVWFGNAQNLIADKICTLMEVIGCRDDIMLYLIQKGLDSSSAFKIMEDVRKGKKLKPEYEELMRRNNVPEWYIQSCNKIQYMFPKAHAVAYVMMALRVAWFKIYYPLEYYASYFTLRCDAYDIQTMIKGRSAIEERLERVRYLLRDRVALKEESSENENKLRKLEPVLEVALEMTERGLHFAPISLEKSDAKAFIVDKENNCLIPPFNTVDGLGEAAAISIVEARKERSFISKNDLLKRTTITSTVLSILDKMGVTSHLQENEQLQFIF